MRIEETLQAVAKSVRAMPDARRIAFHVDVGAKSGKTDEADLVAALVAGGDGPCVKIGVPSDFLPTKAFIVRTSCELCRSQHNSHYAGQRNMLSRNSRVIRSRWRHHVVGGPQLGII